jgi:hypothetical protein
MNSISLAARIALALFSALLMTAPAAQAQLGVYGTVLAAKINNPTSAQSTTFGGTNTGYWTTGGGAGIYYDAWHLGPVSLGLDLRGSVAAQAKTGLGGVRLAIRPPVLPIKPYLEGLVGGTTTSNVYSAQTTDFLYEIVGGIDYTLIPHIDFRVVEVGAGQISNGITTAPTGARSILTVASGIAIHF